MTKKTNFERKSPQKNFKIKKIFQNFLKLLLKVFIHKINFLKVAKLLVVLQHHSTIRRAALGLGKLLHGAHRALTRYIFY